MTPELESLVDRVESDRKLDVIVELRYPDDLALADMEEWFSRASRHIGLDIRRLGGEVTGTVWLNHTLRASVPAERVRELSERENIKILDVPHRISLD